jgi:hypothetical protein
VEKITTKISLSKTLTAEPKPPTFSNLDQQQENVGVFGSAANREIFAI